jgi:hypothetical protein
MQIAAHSNTQLYTTTHTAWAGLRQALRNISTKRKEKVPSSHADFTSTNAQSCQQGNESLNIPLVMYCITKVKDFYLAPQVT